MHKNIIESLYKQGYILEEEREIITYGFNCLKTNLIAWTSIVFLGVVYDRVFESIGFGVLTFALRKNAGGIHAKTRRQCVLMSIIMLLVWFFLFFQIQLKTWCYIIVTVLSVMILWRFAPMENAQKFLDEQEIKVYKQRTRKIIGIQSLLFLFAYLWHWEILMLVVTMSISICSILLIFGKVQSFFLKNRKA